MEGKKEEEKTNKKCLKFSGGIVIDMWVIVLGNE